MKRIDLAVSERSDFGSPESRRLRKQGFIPGVLYGGGGEAVPLSVEEKVLRHAIGHERGSVILNLTFEGKSKAHLAMLKDHQSDPVTGKMLHLDLLEIKMDQPIDSVVAVELVGQAIGLRDGGILDFSMRELHIRSLPTSMPESIQCNVEELAIGNSIHVRDLVAPEGVEITNDPETMVASMLAPRISTAEEVAAEEAAAAEAGGAPAGEAKPAEEEGGEG